MFIEIKGAKNQYGSGEAAVYALDGVDFSLEKGKSCVILGPSGSGKSTLLNMIGGLDSLDSGEITVDGQNITGLSKKALTAYRKKSVGFIFQFYNLIPCYNAVLSDEVLDCKSDEITEIISDKTYETQMDNMMTSMGGLIYAFMIIGMIVCIASLYATINTMISENSHNISMLKVLGYENIRINSMILSSNHLLLIPGIVFGIAAAYGVMAWYCAEFVAIESIIIPATLYPQSILYTTLITAASYFISLLLLRRKVDRTDMIEALKDGRE